MKAVEKIKTHILCLITMFYWKFVICEVWKSILEADSTQKTTWYCACVLHAGYLRLQTHTQNMRYLLHFYSSSGHSNAPPCYV